VRFFHEHPTVFFDRPPVSKVLCEFPHHPIHAAFAVSSDHAIGYGIGRLSYRAGTDWPLAWSPYAVYLAGPDLPVLWAANPQRHIR
jgi:hypothetical protein